MTGPVRQTLRFRIVAARRHRHVALRQALLNLDALGPDV